MRCFVHLAYRGSGFHGWQIQPGAVTVQGVLEKAFSTLLRMPVAVTGAGRTDAGVNARMMVAHVDFPNDTDVADGQFLRSLNSLSGRDIAIYEITQVADNAHARFDATEREYRYFAHTRKNPFAGTLSWQAPSSLDFDAMNTAAELIHGRHDFSSFAKLHSDTKTNICDLRRAIWVRDNDDSWHFEIAADRFLRNMVRAIVGTLADVGRHKLRPDSILEIMQRMDRCAAGTSMPPEPLFLWRIDYPYIKF